MDLRQLRYLVALAEELNFTRAAAAEHIAQPALSQQIRRLEEEVGVGLVERTTRKVALTEAGELLAVRARRILAELAIAREELEALRGVDVGHVTIGAIHTMGPIDLSLALAVFHEAHPGVALTVREQVSEECAELLRADELDLAFLSVTERVESARARTASARLRGADGAAPARPRARRARARVRMAELAQEHFISFRQGARLRELLFAAGRDAQFEPRVTLESNEAQRIRALVSRGLGVAILPHSDAMVPSSDIVAVPIVEPVLRRDITLAWRAGRRQSPATAAFLELALEMFGEGGADQA